MLNLKHTLLAGMLAIAGLTFILGPALADDKKMNKPNPYLKPDESWISISGKVVSPAADSFILDYGKGTVLVEMDDWDWYHEGYKVFENHKVRVYGKIDDDLFETTKIEASSVYDEDLKAYFYASASDEEYDDDYDYWITYEPFTIAQTVVRGTVTGINGREFTIDTGSRMLTVDTSTMVYNPMNETGFQKVDKGDYVSVSGKMENDFWEKRELMADAVVTLYDD